ncbi:MAG TPA: hypothetical protein VFX85_00210, partial [Solirubrobacterales bacterium]|nr:hypothetical protein [Solirubrobacterales bacterium]
MSPGRASRGAMRRTMFLSQDGVVLATTLRGLDRVGVLEPSLREQSSLAQLCPGLSAAAFGAQRVALHGLAAAGWLREPPGLSPERALLRWTETGRAAMEWRRRYIALGDFLAGFPGNADDAWTAAWDPRQVTRFADLVAAREDDGDELPAAVATHLDGGLAVPAMLWLH